VKAKLAEQGSEPVGQYAGGVQGVIANELVKWRRLVEVSGATAQCGGAAGFFVMAG